MIRSFLLFNAFLGCRHFKLFKIARRPFMNMVYRVRDHDKQIQKGLGVYARKALQDNHVLKMFNSNEFVGLSVHVCKKCTRANLNSTECQYFYVLLSSRYKGTGMHWANFVYKFAPWRDLGCWKDNTRDRAVPKLLVDLRPQIDWFNIGITSKSRFYFHFRLSVHFLMFLLIFCGCLRIGLWI